MLFIQDEEDFSFEQNGTNSYCSSHHDYTQERHFPTVQTVHNEGLDHMRIPFAYKLHILLGDMETTGCEHIISWVDDGRAFKIHDRRKFEQLVQPRYFRQSKIASFIRQCHIYGFYKVEGGSSHGSYIHPDFHKNDQAKALTIKRRSSRRTNSSQKLTKILSFSVVNQKTDTECNMVPDMGFYAAPILSGSDIVCQQATRTQESLCSIPMNSWSNSVLDDPLPVSYEVARQSGCHHDKSIENFLNLSMSIEESSSPCLLEPRPIEVMMGAYANQDIQHTTW